MDPMSEEFEVPGGVASSTQRLEKGGSGDALDFAGLRFVDHVRGYDSVQGILEPLQP